MEKNKLQAKDLINVGIFTAIYFVLFFAGMMLGYIPIFIPLLGLVCPIICGIPFMLYLTKVKKFGMVTLSGIILGLHTLGAVGIISVIGNAFPREFSRMVALAKSTLSNPITDNCFGTLIPRSLISIIAPTVIS